MKKSLAELVDELTIVNIKVYNLVDKVVSPEGTIEDAKKLQELNSYRSQLKNAIADWSKERKETKI